MSTWFTDNIGTILISLLLIAIVAGIISSMIKDKKKGKHSCSCGGSCSQCHMCSACRQVKKR